MTSETITAAAFTHHIRDIAIVVLDYLFAVRAWTSHLEATPGRLGVSVKIRSTHGTFWSWHGHKHLLGGRINGRLSIDNAVCGGKLVQREST